MHIRPVPSGTHFLCYPRISCKEVRGLRKAVLRGVRANTTGQSAAVASPPPISSHLYLAPFGDHSRRGDSNGPSLRIGQVTDELMRGNSQVKFSIKNSQWCQNWFSSKKFSNNGFESCRRVDDQVAMTLERVTVLNPQNLVRF